MQAITKEDSAIPVISAIIERDIGGQTHVLIQTRIASYDKMYFGCLEIPAGRIVAGENIFACLRREVQEDTGLQITRIEGESEAIHVRSPQRDEGIAF